MQRAEGSQNNQQGYSKGALRHGKPYMCERHRLVFCPFSDSPANAVATATKSA